MSDAVVRVLLRGWKTDRRPLHVRAKETRESRRYSRQCRGLGVELPAEEAYKVSATPYDAKWRAKRVRRRAS